MTMPRVAGLAWSTLAEPGGGDRSAYRTASILTDGHNARPEKLTANLIIGPMCPVTPAKPRRKVDHFGRFPGEPFAIIAETDNPPSGCLILLPRDALEKLSTQPHTKLLVVK
jgi:hypothetical protein